MAIGSNPSPLFDFIVGADFGRPNIILNDASTKAAKILPNKAKNIKGTQEYPKGDATSEDSHSRNESRKKRKLPGGGSTCGHSSISTSDAES
mmetsp:Transcript_1106/g.1686  ORF Transcript_1106/g.1686 Transcript_1106/m.1686 type:complete len:92 (+) Transcript_1106:287-562(+)